MFLNCILCCRTVSQIFKCVFFISVLSVLKLSTETDFSGTASQKNQQSALRQLLLTKVSIKSCQCTSTYSQYIMSLQADTDSFPTHKKPLKGKHYFSKILLKIELLYIISNNSKFLLLAFLFNQRDI